MLVTTSECGLVMRPVESVSVCLSVCPVRALLLKALSYKLHFWCASTSLEYLGSSSHMKVIGSRSRSQEQA